MINRIILIFLLSAVSFLTTYAQDNHSLEVTVTVDKTLEDQYLPQGRLFLFLSEDARPEPRRQLWPSYQNHAFATNLDLWNFGEKLAVHQASQLFSMADFSLDKVPEGTYYLQILWDQNEEESSPNTPGNLYSIAQKIDLSSDQTIEILIDQIIPPRKHTEHDLVKFIEIKSDTLSKWWGKELKIKASVLLPNTFTTNTQTKFPVRYNIAGYGGRYTRINRLAEDTDGFMKWWLSDQAPQIITVFLDGEGPFGDSYQLDSENSGPYGAALVNELIPYIEENFRAISRPDARFVDGCSTGGWVSLALQLFYPDVFGGTWSYSPDPVHFGQMQLIDLYQDENAFYNSSNYLRPSMRRTNGEPVFSIEKEIALENVSGYSNSFVTSGGQWGAWNALYSPKDPESGLPKAIFDPFTGQIDTVVAEHWKKYDLLEHIKTNWAELGPKLQGKIYIWMGDMDNFYLNNALRTFEKYIEQTENPKSDAQILFSPMKGHCSEYSHREVLEMIGQKIRQN